MGRPAVAALARVRDARVLANAATVNRRPAPKETPVATKTLVSILAVAALSATARPPCANPPRPLHLPAGGKAGTTVEVHLGVYDWTPEWSTSCLTSACASRHPPLPHPHSTPLLVRRQEPDRGHAAAARSAREDHYPGRRPAGAIVWQAANANGATAPPSSSSAPPRAGRGRGPQGSANCWRACPSPFPAAS